MSIPDEEAFVKPFIVDDELRIGAARSSVKKARSSESTVMWATMALIGMVAMVYALRVARQGPAVAAPAPARPPVARTLEPSRPREANRPEAPRPAPRFRDIEAATADSQPMPKAERVATVGEGAARRKAVDPVEGFDTGAAFDNPASPGRYGQRTSGLLERTVLPNNNARPNAPDPSFRSPR